MKLPDEIRSRLTQQWYKGDIREKRLLHVNIWPLTFSIGKPSAQVLESDLKIVKNHISQWRNINVGNVIWEKSKYRNSSGAIELPTHWKLSTPSEWVEATNNPEVIYEFQHLSTIVKNISPQFHKLIVRKRAVYQTKKADEIILATKIALKLTPYCARSKPLRALSIENCDTKFFERNRQLLTDLLDLQYDNKASLLGLEVFLDAINENDHWLLICPLDSVLLPFQQLRVRSSELLTTSIPGTHLIVIENEKSLYQLPRLPNTVAILGAGLDLSWLKAAHYSEKKIAYWGDIDTWGLTMLSNARALQKSITPVMMNRELFKELQHYTVKEEVNAGMTPPKMLEKNEVSLYLELISADRNRLEQEFIPEEKVKQILIAWKNRT